VNRLILNRPLNYGGRLYQSGENVAGQLPPDMIDLLRKNGAITAASDHAAEPPSGESMTIAQLKKLAAETEDVELLAEWLRKERESENPRASAIRFLEERIAELEKSQSLGNSDDEADDEL
jgi:hypothetical protein